MSLSITRPDRFFYGPKGGNHFGIRLMSDLHIGSASVDYELLQAELKDAREKGDRILINGDVFDLIIPSDKKRYRVDAVHPRLQYHTSPVNGAIEWAAELLEPYADLIDMVGVGNHETAVEKYHGTDPVMILLHRLRQRNPKIAHGNYGGFVIYRFEAETGANGHAYTIFYHHGSGGSSPITKGMIDFQRLSAWIEGADLIWIGHKHNRIFDGTIRKVKPAAVKDELEERTVNCIMTGSYMDTYRVQSQADLFENGRKTQYAAEWGCAPQQKGGARIEIYVTTKTFEPRIIL